MPTISEARYPLEELNLIDQETIKELETLEKIQNTSSPDVEQLRSVLIIKIKALILTLDKKRFKYAHDLLLALSENKPLNERAPLPLRCIPTVVDSQDTEESTQDGSLPRLRRT